MMSLPKLRARWQLPLLVLLCLMIGQAARATIVDEFNDGTLDTNWNRSNYPQYAGTPNDGITYTEYTSQQMSENHAPGYLQIHYDENNGNSQVTCWLRNEARVDTNNEFFQVDVRIDSGASSINVAPGLAMAPNDSGILQDRSSCIYYSLQNTGYLKINAYGTNGVEIYDQSVAISGYTPGMIITLRLKRTGTGVFQAWWGQNLNPSNLAGTINFGSATEPRVPGLLLTNGLSDYEVSFDRCVIGTTGVLGDVTAFGAVPNDGKYDSLIIQSVIPDFDQVYLPPGEYDFNSSVYTDSDQIVFGNDYRNVTINLYTTSLIAWRMDYQDNVILSDMTITRKVGNANGSMVRADYGTGILVDRIRCNDNNSTSPAFEFTGCTDLTAFQCLVWNTQRYALISGIWWTHGQGIRMDQCTDIRIAECRIQQEYPLVLTDPTPTLAYYQATGLEVVDCTSGTIVCNLVEKTGQGIDTSLSDHLDVSYNFIDECQSVGIKMVNGSNYINVHDNFVRRCGLTGIWLSCGTPGPGSHDCLVEDNILVKIGYFNGTSGYWNGHFADSVPAGISLGAAISDSGRVKNNTVQNNTAYDNSWMTRGVVSIEGPNGGTQFTATPNTLSGNSTASGEPPVSQYVEVGCSDWLND